MARPAKSYRQDLRELVHGKSHGRVTENDVVLSVVPLDPGTGESLVGRRRATLSLVQFLQEITRQDRVLLAEVPGGMSHGLSQENPSDAVAERDKLGPPDARRPDRITPGPLDMADHRQRAPLGVRQQPLRQARDEPLIGNRDRSLVSVGQVVVERRGPGTIACVHEGHQTLKPSIVVDIRCAEIITQANRAKPGPILAKEGPLRRPLFLVLLGPANAVRGREQEPGPAPAPDGGRSTSLSLALVASRPLRQSERKPC